jgi:hypothetical protein
MTYLEQLYALRTAHVEAAIARAGISSYSLDGESWSASDVAQLEALQRLILMEENRVSGRRELRVVRGRRYAWFR